MSFFIAAEERLALYFFLTLYKTLFKRMNYIVSDSKRKPIINKIIATSINLRVILPAAHRGHNFPAWFILAEFSDIHCWDTE